MCGERGAATVEWTGLVLVVAAVLAGAGATAGALHAPSLARSIRCAVLAGCHGEDRALASAYGDDVAGQVRAWAPGFAYEPGTLTLPVDFRRCRAHRCADAPDARGEDVWRSATGESRATVFTHVVDLRRRGGPLYLQYWLYYPDSTYMGGAYAVSRARFVRDTPVGALAGRSRDTTTTTGRATSSSSCRTGECSSARRRTTATRGAGAGPTSTSCRASHACRTWAGAACVSSATRAPAPGRPTRAGRGSRAARTPATSPTARMTTNGAPSPTASCSSRSRRLSEGDLTTSFAIVPPWRKPGYAAPERTDT